MKPSEITTQVFRVAALAVIMGALLGSSACKSESHSVTVTWQAPSPVGTTSIRGYNVYRGTAPGGPYTPIASGVATTTYVDALVTSGRTYYYVVTTVDQLGVESKYSDEISAVVP